MGLLDRATEFAEKAYNFVVNKDNEAKAGAEVKPEKEVKVISVVNPNEEYSGEVGDKLVKKDNNEIKNFDIDSSIEKMKQKMQAKCKKYGIKYEDIENSILKDVKFSYDEFKSLSQLEQLSVLHSIDGALSLYIVRHNKQQINPATNKAEYVKQTAKNIMEAKEDGGIDDIEEFNKQAGNINDEIENKINENTTDEEYTEILEEARKSFKASLELERIAEIKKCNGDKAKIAEINKKYDARIHAFESQRQTDFAAAKGPKKAHLSIYLRGGKNYAEAHKTAIELYDGEDKTTVANSFTHEFEMEARRRYYESGDPISSEQYAKAVELITQFMSEESLTKFQKDAYEFRKKVEKGEIDAPYLSEEDFTKEATAIATGIVRNTNTSDNNKQFLLNKWHNNIANFSDYEQVIRNTEPLIKGVDKSIQKIVKVFGDKNITELLEEVGNKKATPEQLERALLIMPLDVAKKQFSKNSTKDFIKVVLESPKLKSCRPCIINDLKILTPEDLNSIKLSTDAYLFVLGNIAPDKAGCLYDLSKGKKCYSARVLGKEIIEGQKNAVV